MSLFTTSLTTGYSLIEVFSSMEMDYSRKFSGFDYSSTSSSSRFEYKTSPTVYAGFFMLFFYIFLMYIAQSDKRSLNN
jgi:hypothetical protein